MIASMDQVKYPGLVFSVVWAVVLCIGLLRQLPWRTAVRWTLAGGTFLAAAAAPWYVYVYAGTGNPFFPYLQNWFHSPYWIDGFTLQQVFEKSFKLDPGIGGVLRFPFTATFDTHRFMEGANGQLGFWVIALAPCLLFAPWRKVGSNRAMAAAAVAMIAGIVSYTPYVRYWLPAYPLLLIASVSAAGRLVGVWKRRARTTDPGYSRPGSDALTGVRRLCARLWPLPAAAVLLVLLLLPTPLLFAQLPWDEYAGRISTEKALARRFPGYAAVKQLNRILLPGEGVICTEFDGVCLVAGPSYEYAFWWNKLHGVNDLKSFGDYCRRYNIKYWIANPFLLDLGDYPPAEAIAAEYWTDDRLVTGEGITSIYDVSNDPTPLRKTIRRFDLPAVLEETEQEWTPSGAFRNWIRFKRESAVKQEADALLLGSRALIVHRLRPEFAGGLCKVTLDLRSAEITYPLLEIIWYNEKGQFLCRTAGGLHGNSEYRTWLYSHVPPRAKSGRLTFWEWKGKPIELKGGTVTFWSPLATSPDPGRDHATGEMP